MPMKSHLFALFALTSATWLIAGCQSPSSRPDAASPAQPASAAAITPANESPAPANPAAPANPLAAPIRINAGAAAITDSTGIKWGGDTGFSGGDVTERPDQQIANTPQPEIYHSEHYSMDSFNQKLPNGKYDVKLHFCETFDGITGPGERVFTLEVAGKVLKDFDVWAKAGGFARAYVETVPVEITDGQLTIKFTPQVENPQINAIEIIPVQ